MYPNADHFYFKIPMFFSLDNLRQNATTGQFEANDVDLQSQTFWGLEITTSGPASIWWDVLVVWTVSIYYSLVNLWILFRPVKIVLSGTAKTKLKEYAQI